MLITDFEYANECLSDFGCIVCCINTAASDSISLGSQLSFTTTKNNATNVSRLISAKYDEVYTTTFDICKINCKDLNSDMNLTDIELRRLVRWLNRKKFYKFKPRYADGQFSNVCFYGSFNVTGINVGGRIVGLTLTFTANAPFGYEEEINYNYSIYNCGDEFHIYDSSDEFGINYPTSIVITCSESGDLTLSNMTENRDTIIRNCSKGEIITMDCENKIITSSDDAHTTLFNDFNYNFPRFINTFGIQENIFQVSLPCKVAIKYSPICKVGVMI